MSTFALVDGNNFYASCERAFNPRLRDKAIVVLSNNDGCVVARSAEAKALGIEMGEPWHQIKDKPEIRSVIAYSSNYTLYADMSRRVFDVLSTFSPDVEPYSIDETFVMMDGIPGNLVDVGRAIRADVLKHAKIPTCVGFGPTKTIAKLANRVAKKNKYLHGVCNLMDKNERNRVFEHFPIDDVWGIGRAATEKLAFHGATTVADFLSMPATLVRQLLTVTGLRTQEELRGVSCIPFAEERATRKGLAVTRSFSTAVTDKESMSTIIASFANRAGEKLRNDKLVAGHVTIFIRTSPFRAGPTYAPHASMKIKHTSDSMTLSSLAVKALDRIWKDGYNFAKGGVMLSDIADPNSLPKDLFSAATAPKNDKIMEAIDALNNKLGRALVRPALMGMGTSVPIKAQHLSNRYTTEINEILEVAA